MMADDPEDALITQEHDTRKLKPPNKKRFEEDLESCTAQIKAIEAELKSLSLRGDESLPVDARSIRAEINATIERRKKIDNELRMLNQSISKQMDKLTKIQSALHYRSEDRISEAIRRLEYQMKTHNFKLSEEKKIVAEIDSLNRSRKSLVQYQTLKKEIDSMRDSQRRMRGERDYYFKAVTQLKNKEEEMKKRSSANHNKAVELKKELDSLYENKRMLISNFRKIEKEYYDARGEVRKKLREESFKRREEERKAHMEARLKEIDEYEAAREPYEDEKLLCNTLITYLQRYLVASDDHHGEQDHESQSQLQQGSVKKLEEKEGLFVLKKKKSEDEELFGGIQRSKGKRSKRDKRKSAHMLNKPITHSPEIFSQFAQLNLSAPSSILDVPASLEQLNSRKEYYASLPQQIKAAVQVELPDNESHTESSASMSESAICESIPSTPEVHHDNQAPAFPASAELEVTRSAYPLLRKLSADSGTGDDLNEERTALLKLNIDDKIGGTVAELMVANAQLSSCSVNDLEAEPTSFIDLEKCFIEKSCEANQTEVCLSFNKPSPGCSTDQMNNLLAGGQVKIKANADDDDNNSVICSRDINTSDSNNQGHDPQCRHTDTNSNENIAPSDTQLLADNENQNRGLICSGDRNTISELLIVHNSDACRGCVDSEGASIKPDCIDVSLA